MIFGMENLLQIMIRYMNKMSSLMEQLGYQKLDKQDQVILIEIFDVYRDKKIDKKDLMAIFSYILSHTTA